MENEEHLWDFETNSHEELVNLYHVHKLHQRGISLQNEFIKVYKKINHQCWEDYRKNLITKEKLRSERFMKTLLHFGIDDKKLANELGDDYVHNSRSGQHVCTLPSYNYVFVFGC